MLHSDDPDLKVNKKGDKERINESRINNYYSTPKKTKYNKSNVINTGEKVSLEEEILVRSLNPGDLLYVLPYYLYLML